MLASPVSAAVVSAHRRCSDDPSPLWQRCLQRRILSLLVGVVGYDAMIKERDSIPISTLDFRHVRRAADLLKMMR